ncbi:transposase [Acetobacter sp. DmW_136]|uniref:transposase n=1 Tax=Acetobacter sp. DmW_136 TaxID=2591091 RepID=UPI001EE2498C|nr:transposase [Acetobacter sp. DmW_136]
MMAHRLIGQDCLEFSLTDRGSSSLDKIATLIDWQPIAEILSPLYSVPKGEAAWPPLSMFKAMLLAVWYDLSDVKLAEALDDRMSFRRFCGFSVREPTPERTAFVRFRRLLTSRSLDKALFEAVTVQLKTQAIRIKVGTIIDATIIASQTEHDNETRWVKHKDRKAVYGFKAHVGADAITALVERIAITPARLRTY